jgi:hypothetical protein
MENIKTEIHVLCPTYFISKSCGFGIKQNGQNVHIFKFVHGINLQTCPSSTFNRKIERKKERKKQTNKQRK